jgi:hypothetical protein
MMQHLLIELSLRRKRDPNGRMLYHHLQLLKRLLLFLNHKKRKMPS